jgi:DNA modification methylase
MAQKVDNPTFERASELQVQYVDLAQLTHDPANSRFHAPAQIKQIAASVKAFEFNSPILVDKDYKILAGHGRALALKLLGWTNVPVIMLDHLTPEQARAYAIADNKLTDNSSFDKRQLALHFKALAELDLGFSLEATGFTMGEIDLSIESLSVTSDVAGADTADEGAPPTGPAVAKLGQVWRLGKHRLICGSSLEEASFARLLGGELVQCAFNDPPYGPSMRSYFGARAKREFVQGSDDLTDEALSTFLGTALELAVRHSANGAVHFNCIDWRGQRVMLNVCAELYGQHLNTCVWSKNPGMGALYRSAHEMVLVHRVGKSRHRNNVQLGKWGKNRTNVWSYPGASMFVRGSEDGDLIAHHPTPKPVALVKDALLDVSARGELVLDAFTGAGATLLACERTGRRFRGIELDPLYIDLAIRRWQRLTGENAVLESTGERFDELAQMPGGQP